MSTVDGKQMTPKTAHITVHVKSKHKIKDKSRFRRRKKSSNIKKHSSSSKSKRSLDSESESETRQSDCGIDPKLAMAWSQNKTEHDDELIALGAIYGDDFALLGDGHFRVRVPMSYNDESATQMQVLTIEFWLPKGYPSHEPPLCSCSDWSSAQTTFAKRAMTDIWRDGDCMVMVTEFICWIHENTELMAIETGSQHTHGMSANTNDDSKSNLFEQIPPPYIITGSSFVDRKSKFVAHIARVQCIEDVGHVMRTLYMDKRIANATHNIAAWRIQASDKSPCIEDHDDDGEHGASQPMLFMLQKMDLWDILVVTTRWYGGIKLGGDRFRIITGVVKTVLDETGITKAKSVPTSDEEREQIATTAASIAD
jgi:Uncharacterized protein family UPF0029/RWD domain